MYSSPVFALKAAIEDARTNTGTRGVRGAQTLALARLSSSSHILYSVGQTREARAAEDLDSIRHTTPPRAPRGGGDFFVFVLFVYVCCTQEHDGDYPFYIREFHIPMRHYVY